MSSTSAITQAFYKAMQTMEARREAFNRADTFNANHGDHMVEIFQAASQAVHEEDNLAEAMRHAANRLAGLGRNGTAQVYARGLYAFADQFQQRQIGVNDLLPYLHHTLHKGEGGQPPEALPRAGDILKALMGGLADWKHAISQAPTDLHSGDLGGPGVDMAFLFELGAAYMAAKSRGGSRIEVVADAAITASPLSQVAYRAESGKAAMHALLESLAS